MTNLDEWLKTVPVLALKAFAEDMPGVRETRRNRVEEFVLTNPEARERATRSMEIERKVLGDGWTAVTRDRSLSAQFEHTIGVTKTGVEVFTYSPKGLDKPPYASSGK